MIYTRLALARFFTLLALRIIPSDAHGAAHRLWQANDSLKLWIAALKEQAK